MGVNSMSPFSHQGDFWSYFSHFCKTFGSILRPISETFGSIFRTSARASFRCHFEGSFESHSGPIRSHRGAPQPVNMGVNSMSPFLLHGCLRGRSQAHFGAPADSSGGPLAPHSRYILEASEKGARSYNHWPPQREVGGTKALGPGPPIRALGPGSHVYVYLGAIPGQIWPAEVLQSK